MGFEIIFQEEFHPVRPDNDNGPTKEILFALWNPTTGCLLKFETYGMHHINSGDLYFAFKPSDEKTFFKNVRASGHFWCKDYDHPTIEDMIWVGSIDVREGFKLNVELMQRTGMFITPWPEDQHIQMNNYVDWKKVEGNNYSYPKAESNRRMLLLPEAVLTAIKYHEHEEKRGKRNRT
jgi:hypothetical protein